MSEPQKVKDEKVSLPPLPTIPKTYSDEIAQLTSSRKRSATCLDSPKSIRTCVQVPVETLSPRNNALILASTIPKLKSRSTVPKPLPKPKSQNKVHQHVSKVSEVEDIPNISTSSYNESIEELPSIKNTDINTEKMTGSNLKFMDFNGPVIDDKSKIFFQEPQLDVLPDSKILEFKDWYSEKFFSQVHLNFLGIQNDKKDECVVVSVLRKTKEGKYSCLKIDKKGSELFEVDTSGLLESGKNLTKSNERKHSNILERKLEDFTDKDKRISLSEKLEAYLSTHITNTSFYFVPNTTFPQDLKQVEIKHPKQQYSFKIAVLYSSGKETTLQDFFAHKEASPSFFQFLDTLGEKINIKGWKKYRGDIGAEIDQDAYYTEWRGIEVIFHVCIWMNAEQHRRLIGNDVVFLIFHDNEQPFDPAPLDSLGTVPQIFGVVKKHNEIYRIGFFSRPNIKSYSPHLNSNCCFPKEELKDYLLTKAYNGYCHALTYPPMNRLFEVPRADTLTELLVKYPKLTKKEQHIRRNSAKKRTKLLVNKNSRDPLLLLVTVISVLPPRNKVLSSPYVMIKLQNTEHKTKVGKLEKDIKGKKDPKKPMVWNEILAFPDLVAIDPALSHVRVELREASKLGHSEKVGQVEISFLEICKVLNKEHWFELDSEISTQEELSGAVSLRFDLKGPPILIMICPKCKLYLGASDLVQYKDVNYHEHCFTCENCCKKLGTIDFVERNENFYCIKCDEKKFSLGELTTQEEINQAKVISGINNLEIGDGSPHNWNDTVFKNALSWCGFCGDHITFGTHGFQCLDCKYPCHKECVDQIPGNCSHDSKTQELHSKPPSEKVKKVVAKVSEKPKAILKSPGKSLKDSSPESSSRPKGKSLSRRKSERIDSLTIRRSHSNTSISVGDELDNESEADTEHSTKESTESSSSSLRSRNIRRKSLKQLGNILRTKKPKHEDNNDSSQQ